MKNLEWILKKFKDINRNSAVMCKFLYCVEYGENKCTRDCEVCKFNNDGQMILDWFKWDRGGNYPKIHPTQKPVSVLKRLIQIYTDVVIDPVAGSGSTLRACAELNRSCYGFEIKKKYYKLAKEKMLSNVNLTLEI